MRFLAAALVVSLVGTGAGRASHAATEQQAAVTSPTELAAAINALGTFDDAARSAARRTVRRTDAGTAVPALIQAARENPDGYVRYAALVLLGGFGEISAKDVMVSVLSDKNDRLRAAAYAWFQHHPDLDVLPRLIAALDTEASEFVRPSLTRAIAASSSDPRARSALLPLITRGQDFFRAEVIAALGDARATFAMPPLLDVAKLDGPLQEEAVLALGQIGDRAALPVFAELQRSAPPERQPAIAAAICLLGVNCANHEAYLVQSVKFGSDNGTFQPLLRGAAHALAVLAVRGNATALGALFDAGIPARDPSRAPLALAIGLVALRSPAIMMDALQARPDRDAAIDLLRDAFDMLSEDFEEEQFYVAVRRAYWAAPEGSPRRALAEALIKKLEF
jgi:HEAT repeat protein